MSLLPIAAHSYALDAMTLLPAMSMLQLLRGVSGTGKHRLLPRTMSLYGLLYSQEGQSVGIG